LFIFWELTSISSFLLIGYKNSEAESRQSAIVALAVTGLGGLFLLAFAIYAGHLFGTYSIQEILSGAHQLSAVNWGILMFLLFAAAFTKSAQFPFHFWLPGAMKAPTPVSTYLHSATMVKAGIFLLLRFNPLFETQSAWGIFLLSVGGFTMFYAAFQTLFRVDMKSILAYSTISALGVIVFLIGLGGKYAMSAAIVFILAHALYKATLFMVTGIVDHETGTRDVTRLSGLRKVMPVVMVVAVAAALSNAGIPLFMGFLAKDMIYEATLHHGQGPWLLSALAVGTNVFIVYAGFVVGWKPFAGNLPDTFSKVHAPNIWLWLPPAVTATLGLIIGVLPALIKSNIYASAVGSITSFEMAPLKLWHGLNLVLVLSLTTLFLGVLLYVIRKPNYVALNRIIALENYSPKAGFQWFYGFFQQVSLWVTKTLQNGYLRNYVLIIILALITAMSYHVFKRPGEYLENIVFTKVSINEIVLVIILVGSTLFTVFSKSRLAAIAGLGVLGYAICFVFVFYSAPDLALTQFSIDTLTVILFVLVLYNLPPYLKLSNNRIRYRDMGVAGVFGTLITLVALEAIAEVGHRSSHVADYYNENAYLLAKGKNIVNVILVDFRGADTLIETVVLAISAIGVFGLIKLRMVEKKTNK
jgi:multicomponent Na+:H+ antiporter subunit A